MVHASYSFMTEAQEHCTARSTKEQLLKKITAILAGRIMPLDSTASGRNELRILLKPRFT